MLKRVFETRWKGRVSFSICPSEESAFVKNMNGRTLGKTLNAQALIPFSPCAMYFAGLIIMLAIKNKMSKENINFKRLSFFSFTKRFFKITPFLFDNFLLGIYNCEYI